MKVFVCGGAGYIGSHCSRELVLAGHEVVVFDNLKTGHKRLVDMEKMTFVQGDVRDANMADILKTHKPDAVMHFCADSIVPFSVKDPLAYYDNNVNGAMCLLKAMKEAEVDKIIFSSTAAIFGQPETIPIKEDDPQVPTNPYGETKLAIEKMLHWTHGAHGIRYVALRYFNACGADQSADIGELHNPETHLIPIVMQVVQGQREKMFIFGDDYNTPDGTCVRDYVHVTDLASAHLKALNYLGEGNESNRFNLGSGTGYSVKEIIEASRKVTGHAIPTEIGPRRAGDPDSLIASSEKAAKVLGWTRKYTSVEDIIRTAHHWHQKIADEEKK